MGETSGWMDWMDFSFLDVINFLLHILNQDIVYDSIDIKEEHYLYFIIILWRIIKVQPVKYGLNFGLFQLRVRK